MTQTYLVIGAKINKHNIYITHCRRLDFHYLLFESRVKIDDIKNKSFLLMKWIEKEEIVDIVHSIASLRTKNTMCRFIFVFFFRLFP